MGIIYASVLCPRSVPLCLQRKPMHLADITEGWYYLQRVHVPIRLGVTSIYEPCKSLLTMGAKPIE